MSLDGFILSRTINNCKRPFLDKWDHIEQRFEAVDSIIFFTKMCIYQTWHIFFCQNPDLNRRTDKILNLNIYEYIDEYIYEFIYTFTLLKLQSSNTLTSRDITFFRPVCEAKITYRGFSSWVVVLTAYECPWQPMVFCNRRYSYRSQSENSYSNNDRFPMQHNW